MVSLENYNNMMYSLALSFHRTTGIDLDELVSEALLAFVESSKTYDENKAAFSTHLWRNIKNRLVNLSNKAKKMKKEVPFIEDDEDDDSMIAVRYGLVENFTPEDYLIFKELIEELSPEAREICKAVLDDPAQFNISKPKQSKSLLTEKLLAMGWKKWRVDAAYQEIRMKLSEA